MKKVQKVLALLLVFMMVFTTAGMNVAAAGEMDSVAGEADIQSQEQQQTLDETDTQQVLLVFMMVFTTAGMNVAAAGEMDSVAGEADIQSQEQQQTLDETDTQQEATQQTSEGILEYVYVDESVVNMPQTQNIAVGFSDENLVLESAVLHYSSVVTGEQFEMPTGVYDGVYYSWNECGGSWGDGFCCRRSRYTITGATADFR